jgi:cytochrome c-type biogenesis protein CcmH
LAQKAPEDPQALAMAAQARFLAADRQLDGEAQLLAERALAVDPGQRTALGLLGMASFENEAYAAAINYWGRLQAQEAPGSPGYDMLEQVIAVAAERGGLSTAVVAAPTVDESAPGISVSLALPEDHQTDPQAVVFVFARRAGAQGGMPIAVRRLQAAQLPLTLR